MRENEKTVRRLEKKKEKLEAALLEAGTDHSKLSELGASLAEVNDQLGTAEEEWLELAEEQERR